MCGLGRALADAEHFRSTFGCFDVDAEENLAVIIDHEGEKSAKKHDVLEGGREGGRAPCTLDSSAGDGGCSAERV